MMNSMAKKKAGKKSPAIFPTMEQVRQLPVQLSMAVPPEWEDRNGHVNVQYYQTLYELGGYQVLEDMEVGDAYLQATNFGLFDLEHHLHYRAEIMVGDQVSCFNRILARNDKRFHGIYFIVNDSRETLACTLEYITAGVTLGLRRTAVFPPELNRRVEQLCLRHQQLEWPAPACGVLSV